MDFMSNYNLWLEKAVEDEDLIKELTTAIKNKELGFGHGLTNAEIEGMTKADIQLLLKHSFLFQDL